MRWKITIEGMDEFGGRENVEMVVEKEFSGLSKGEIGLSISNGKAIMARLQQLVVKQQCEAYVLTSRYCSDCQTFRRIKDYGKRKIRTVYGRVEVSNPRIMNCRRCLPYFCDASAVLRGICPDQATPELLELSARMGSLMPYRKGADVLAEFLPIPSTESFMTLRHRTMKLGERLDEKARDRAWFEPPSSSEHQQAELDLPNDPEREFVVSIDTAHVRGSRSETARIFEIAVARCGRGRRGSPPGHYFATADTSKRELCSRTLQALQHEGYVGRGEVTVISDGAEIMKRLPKALPKPTAHILDWFPIAMKIQPLQQMADKQMLDRLPDGEIRTDIPHPNETREGAALVEGFRGDIFVWVRVDATGAIDRCHLRDPSWFQWPLLEAAIEGNIVADFPLCNKSFNCSYSGQDL